MLKGLGQFLPNGLTKIKHDYSKYSNNQKMPKGQERQYNELFDFMALIKAWPKIVGEPMAKHTHPLKIQNKYLIILTSHSAFSDQLSFMEEVIKKKLISYFPHISLLVKRIKFQVNQTFFTKKNQSLKTSAKKNLTTLPQKLHPQSPEYQRLKKLALEEFIDIDDSKLKETLISIFIQSRTS